MRQRDRDRFVKKANALIESLGATMGDDDRWHLETKVGDLALTVDEWSAKRAGPGPGQCLHASTFQPGQSAW